MQSDLPNSSFSLLVWARRNSKTKSDSTIWHSPDRGSTSPRHIHIPFGWLENSDSLSLAIICGMLGVGLIGCIRSSFVRQLSTRKPDDPWISDAFPVIIRGFTTAIVVYLAIQGGLNVFSAQTNQANPYVLLFFCLVGAVFSEGVWVAAHNRLKSADIRANGDGNVQDGSTEGDKAKQENEQPVPKDVQKHDAVTAEKNDNEKQEGEKEVPESTPSLDQKDSANPSGNDGKEEDKPALSEE